MMKRESTKEVTVMKGTKMMQARRQRPQTRTTKNPPTDRVLHDQKIRRSTNHNVHVITPHGKLHLGRKGRSE